MSNFMRQHQNASADKLSEFRDKFTRTCQLVLDQLGEKPFHIWSGLNVAAYDSVFTALSKVEAKPGLAERYENLVSDADFVKGVRGATADEAIVELRMLLAKKYFSE